ncbi:MAG TPA: fused MFS/spermidine synthase [Vicinamibacteria bacterium]|nr:fused MFS/spermidine synthase [Vicinamibacteria bacterium]
MRRDTPAVVLAGLLFFLSGAAALVYQVAWQRLLALHSGVGLYSVAMIVGAFMAGLGVGSHLGGRLSTRLAGRRAPAAFAALELGISAFGAASTWVYYDWLYPRAVHLPSASWHAGLLHLAALLPPTTLMGMSLPFLVRAVVTDVEAAGRRIGWLYGVNTLGAAAGAFATPWVLLPALGVRGGVLAAASANLVVGLGALGLFALRGRAASAAEAATKPASFPDGAEAPGSRPLALWLGLYALSGFVALSLEIVWFRVLDVAVKSTAFTFGTVLAVYLLGSALGALLAASRVGRIRRPLRAFLLAQCALLALAALPLLAVVALPPGTRGFSWFVEYWAAYDFFPFGHEADRASIVRLYVLLPLMLFFVPTVLMGVSFPILQRAVHDDPATSGRKVGVLQAANIAGCVAGSLLVGLVSLEHLGTPGTLRLLLVAGLAFAAVGLRCYGRAFVLPALLLVSLAVLVPGPDRLWRRLHGVPPDVPLVFFEEDATGIVAVTPDDGSFRLSVNGKGNSWMPYGSGHTLLGAMPATVHPAPVDVAVVGLGSGDTAWAAAWRPETRSLTVFEISAPQPRILWRLVGFVDVTDTRHLLEDPRLRVRIEDGRKALEAGEDTYDLIETDATWPETAGSGNLYSVEFFAAASRRLKPGGVVCTWAPTPRVAASFRAVFPHALAALEDEVLIGGLAALPLQPAVWAARAASAEPYLGAERTRQLLEALRRLRPAGPVPRTTLNRDLFPRDEYAVR